jgi:hypothetical protein
MRLITEEPVNEGKLYLLYTCEPDYKKIVIFKPVDDRLAIITSTTITSDIYGNHSVFEYTNPHELVGREELTLHKSLHIAKTCVYQLSEHEANLVLAQVI